MNILYAVLVLGVLGAVFGLGLSIASRLFAVKQDERLEPLAEALPGANCGGCGFAGCAAYAAAVASGNAPIGKCGPGGPVAAEKMAAIMGVAPGDTVLMTAFVRCGGGDAAAEKFYYRGIADCLAASRLGGGGQKACAYACLGFGTCAAACPFGAISVVSGVAGVDEEKCTGCMACLAACPKSLIVMKPRASRVAVACASRDKGPVVRSVCGAGCIACGLCEKVCRYDAVHVADNLAAVDYGKCVSCGECVEKCPRNIIYMR